MRTLAQENTKHTLVSYNILALGGKATRSRTRDSVRAAIANGDASAEFEAVIQRPDGTRTTVKATWFAVRNDYGDFYWTPTEDTIAMDKEDSMWSTLIDAVAMYDILTAAHYKRVEDKQAKSAACR